MTEDNKKVYSFKPADELMFGQAWDEARFKLLFAGKRIKRPKKKKQVKWSAPECASGRRLR